MSKITEKQTQDITLNSSSILIYIYNLFMPANKHILYPYYIGMGQNGVHPKMDC